MWGQQEPRTPGGNLMITYDCFEADSTDGYKNLIPVGKDLDLTNGRYWTVRRQGTHLNSDWDWELRIEAWGCAEYGE